MLASFRSFSQSLATTDPITRPMKTRTVTARKRKRKLQSLSGGGAYLLMLMRWVAMRRECMTAKV
jgi:ABC-type sugar transport system ATPase subunit